ncbi:MAG: hypothetical protein HY785_03370 [Oscillatoriophycideae cyanobacterium NC_groundwater_1537_Pr4_S-0.65um_50_18]|nr:hypothetical protein [Oscillatoriophycideae cyanobacterium NC_groundwater_1537_Pr4_S-0.65um_50_18]
MSESNAPFHHPGQRPDQAESADALVDWENPFADLAEGIPFEGNGSLEDLFFEANTDVAGVQTDANEIDIDEIALAAAVQAVESSPTPHRSPSTDPIAAIAAWSENAATEPAEVDVTDLISLIQELNQCNSILLDRVSQLEEALESSQVALQAEVGRSQDSVAEPPSISSSALPAAPDAIVSLFNQLEFAHQANQRQQILIETLTGQLESSQERVAELERESALIQQRCNEQVQLLAQTEGSNRDLQARLHRQQRYTLQFKAALEKCLEVPTPQYDMGTEAMAEAIMGDNPFLLKTQKIQPWSAQAEAATAQFPWMKLYPVGLSEPDEVGETLEPEAEATPEISVPSPTLPIASEAASETASETVDNPSKLKLPLELDESSIPNPTLAEMAPPISFDSNPQPQSGDVSSDLAHPDPVVAIPSVPPATSFKLEAEAQSRLPGDLPEGGISDAIEGEDALWQDLARLIEVSTEDMVRASLSGDFSAFEAINFDALPADQSLAHASTVPPVTPEPQPASSPQSMSQSMSESMPVQEPTVEEETPELDESFIPALSQPSWPSPVVYPLRSTKKQRPAGVDLPSFLRPGTDPLPT